MNVLSLPDEMLASVTKYTKQKEHLKMRRLSKRLDGVTKKYKLNREIFSSIRFTQTHKSYLVQLEYKLGFRNKPIFDENNGRGDFRMINLDIDRVMKRVRKVNTLEFNEMVIDENTINKLSMYAKALRGHALTLSLCDINISAEKLKNYVNMMRLSKLEIRYCRFPDEKSLSDQLLAEISPSTSVILTGVNAPKITLLSMERRKSSDGLLSLKASRTGITFDYMMKFIKANDLRCDIDFGILNKSSRNDDVYSLLLNELPEAECILYQCEAWWTKYWFTPNPNSGSVEFYISQAE